MNKPESQLENKAHKILSDFEVQTDHLILARRQDWVIVSKKENIPNRGLWHPNRLQKKNKREKDKYFDLTRGKKKLWNMKVTVITIVIGALSMIPKGLVEWLEKLETTRRAETIQATALFGLATILRRVQQTRKDLLSLTLNNDNNNNTRK